MLPSLLLLAAAVPQPDVAAALDAVKSGRLRTGVPTAGLLLQRGESGQPQPLVTLFRQARRAGDETLTMVWHARLATLANPTLMRAVGSDECPALAVQGEKLQTVSPGRLSAPPSPVPPRAVLHADLYTVWGGSRQADNGWADIQVTTSSGPVAEWAAETYKVVEDCLDGVGSRANTPG